MDKIKKALPFYAVILLDFYLLPLFIRGTGSAILFMLIVLPLVCLLAAGVYGVINGFHIWFSLIVAVMFLPSVFLFYNESAWGYSVAYGIIALAGNAAGTGFGAVWRK